MIKSLDTCTAHRPAVVFAVSGTTSSVPPCKSIECESLNRTHSRTQGHSADFEDENAGLGNFEKSQNGLGHFANLNQGIKPMTTNVLPFTPRKSVSQNSVSDAGTDNVVQFSKFKQRAHLRRVATGVFFMTPGSFGPDGATAA